MFEYLKGKGYEKAPTLNQFIKDLDPNENDAIQIIKAYNDFLEKEPKRSDFLCFDCDGFALNEHNPVFEGWEVSVEASNLDKNIQVAKKDGALIYFGTADGVVVINDFNMSDNVKYNDLFIFFEGELIIN